MSIGFVLILAQFQNDYSAVKSFSLPTAPQILRVERRRLTISSECGIITAEKEFMRSWILDFLTAF